MWKLHESFLNILEYMTGHMKGDVIWSVLEIL